MSADAVPIVELDGSPPSSAELVAPALVNYGHFTAMQVRGGAVRGLAEHLQRLRAAHAELFGSDLDPAAVRSLMRRAVRSRPDAYLRVTVYEAEPGVPRVMTVVRPPVDPAGTAQSLLPVPYVRPFPHLKHVGTFAQIRYGLLAERSGHDDALLVGPDGRISETTTANVGFLDGGRVVWPDGPCLRGITWQLLDRALRLGGTEVLTRAVTPDAVGEFDAAFVANSVGIAAVGRVGEHRYGGAADRVAPLVARYDRVPWDRL